MPRPFVVGRDRRPSVLVFVLLAVFVVSFVGSAEGVPLVDPPSAAFVKGEFERLESVSVNATGIPIAGFYDPIEKRNLFVVEANGLDSRIYYMKSLQLSAVKYFTFNFSEPVCAAVFQPRDVAYDGRTVRRGIYVATTNPIRTDADERASYRVFRLNPSTFETEAALSFTFPDGRITMVLDEGRALYIASQSRANAFYSVNITDNFSVMKSLSTPLNVNPSSGFVDKDSRFVYFISYSLLDPKVVRIDTQEITINSTLNLLRTEGRVSSVIYDHVYDYAYLPLDTRVAGLASVNLYNLTLSKSLKFNDGEQSLTVSLFDSRTSFGYVGSRSAPAYIYLIDFSKPNPVYLGKVALKVPEDFIYSASLDVDNDISVWGGQGYIDNPTDGLFPIFVSVRIPTEDITTVTPAPGGGKESDSDLSIPLPIFVATMFVSVGAVALLAVVYYKKKQAQPMHRYDRLQGNPDDNALLVDPQVKIIDYSEIEMLECIGMGGMGEVHRAIWNGTEIAVKKLHMSYQNLGSGACKDISEEMLLHSSLRHPNIINFLGACIYVPNICICMEYMPRHSLYEVLHNQHGPGLEWKLILRMAQDAARGMNFLHCSKPAIIHRDLKSHNLLVDSNWSIKVTDFGSARMKQHFAYTMTCIGTPQWMAPEVIRGEKYTEKCDVFSFGIVLWEMYTRDDPHKGMNPIQVATAVAFRDLRPTVPPQCPPTYASLFTECWDSNPKARPTFREILSRLTKMVAPS